MDLMILKEKRFFKKRNWDILIELNPSINTKLKIVKKSEKYKCLLSEYIIKIPQRLLLIYSLD